MLRYKNVRCEVEGAIAIDRIWHRLQQLWKAFLGEEPAAAVETRWHYELQKAAGELTRVLQQLDLKPGTDYSIRIQPNGVGVSLHSAKAAAAVKTNPMAKSAFDRFMGYLGALEGCNGQPCRFPHHPTYAQNWKKMK